MNGKLIADAIKTVLKLHSTELSIPIWQRSKFEGWLKIELASYFKNKCGFNTSIEHQINSYGFVDIYSDHSLIELKTPNTNYCGNTVPSKTKPITYNIQSVINDISKLKNVTKSINGIYRNSFVAFVMFPIDTNKNDYQRQIVKVCNQLQTNNINQQIVSLNINSIQVDVLVFVGEV